MKSIQQLRQQIKMAGGKQFSRAINIYQKKAPALKEGFKMVEVDEATAKMRITICENCPAKKWDAEKRQCKDCGCGIDVKVTLKYEPFIGFLNANNKQEIKCPLEYW